ncbi:MAG TPA: hypothetical protein PLK35_00580 [Candidatus Moranbacteria bacterium]|nr:hypothetical protein [Candidatus Moranbacteria bacterium]
MKIGKIKNKKGLFAGKRGFSLLEAILSVFIVSVGLVAVMSLLTASIKETLGSRSQQVASLLAQEGVELVRNIRDNNWARQLDDSFNGIDAANNCTIAYNSTLSCSGDYKLSRNTSGYYVHNSNLPDTRFSRKIIISGGANVRRIISMVVWDRDDFPGSVDGCTTKNKCSYAEITLTKWGGND